MNSDFRVSVGFPHHRKTKKLMRRLGPAGVCAVVFLWADVAQNNPTGDLSGWSSEDLAISAQWEGEPEELVKALTECGFLDSNPMALHDWGTHNGYASSAAKRSEAARAKAMKRWEGQQQSTGNAGAMPQHNQTNAGAMPTATGSNAPSPLPSPSPSPLPKPTRQNFTPDDFAAGEEIFSAILAMNPGHKTPNLETWANEIRLMRERDGRTLEQILDLFRWANSDAFWKTNILSPAKLREKWDALQIRRNEGPRKPAGRQTLEEKMAANDAMFDQLIAKAEAEEAAKLEPVEVAR